MTATPTVLLYACNPALHVSGALPLHRPCTPLAASHLRQELGVITMPAAPAPLLLQCTIAALVLHSVLAVHRARFQLAALSQNRRQLHTSLQQSRLRIQHVQQAHRPVRRILVRLPFHSSVCLLLPLQADASFNMTRVLGSARIWPSHPNGAKDACLMAARSSTVLTDVMRFSSGVLKASILCPSALLLLSLLLLPKLLCRHHLRRLHRILPHRQSWTLMS